MKLFQNAKMIVLKLVMIAALAFFPGQALFAGDEALMSPYTQIDPETGFPIPIESNNNMHGEESDINEANNNAIYATEEIYGSEFSISNFETYKILIITFSFFASVFIVYRLVRNN